MVRFADLLSSDDTEISTSEPTVASAPPAAPAPPRVVPDGAGSLAPVVEAIQALHPGQTALPEIEPDPGPALEAAFLGWRDAEPAAASAPRDDTGLAGITIADDDLLPRSSRRRFFRR